MPLSMLRSWTIATSALTKKFIKVRIFSALRVFSHWKMDWMKWNNLVRLLKGKVNGVVNCVFIGRADHRSFCAEPQNLCMISVLFGLMKYLQMPLLMQTRVMFFTRPLSNLRNPFRTKSNVSLFQPVGPNVSLYSIEKKTYARGRAGMVVACMNAETNKYLLEMPRTPPFEGLLASSFHFGKTLSLKKVSARNLTKKRSCFSSSKKSVLFEEEATDRLRRMCWTSCNAVEAIITQGRLTRPDDSLHQRFCGRSTKWIDSLTTLPGSDF